MKYKVKVIAVSGIGNSIFSNGEEVDGDMFPVGHAEQYVKTRHLERVEEKKKAEKPANKPKDTNPPNTVDVPDYNDITAGKIKAYLKSKNVAFKANDGKKNLYKLYTPIYIKHKGL